ncbi:MAG: M23 family metallopeptidase [Kordiimonadaceae bacterium]|nr:M23 family metallopeptidase [Kordiimonadaceae bacterium]
MKLTRLLLASCAAITGTMFSAAACAINLQGHLTQGGMVWGKTTAGTQIILGGKPVKVGAGGAFVFGFGRDAGRDVLLVTIDRDGTRHEQTLHVAQRTFDVERVEGLPPKTVTPPPEWRERRAVERSRVGKARSFTTDKAHWQTGFLKPAEGRFSGFYGSQRILNGKPRSPHYGLDIAAAVGQPVTAPAGGTVRLAASNFLLEGGIVIIDHGFGVTSTLFHMNSVDVTEGQEIEKGALIGTIGAKGRASGPHVDWRVNWGNIRLDPMLLIENNAG